MHLLVIEDCSTDDSFKLLKKYIKKYNLKVEILQNKKNMGIAYSTQRIYENLKTKYFAILDADDCYISPEKIQRGVEFLETHEDYSCWASNYLNVFSDGKMAPIFQYPPKTEEQKSTTYQGFRQFPIFQATSTILRNFFTPDLLKKVLSYPEGSPKMIIDELRAEPLRLLLASRYGKLYFDNFIGNLYRCDMGNYGITSDFEKDLMNMAVYYRLFDFYVKNFNADDNCSFCLELAFKFYRKSWNDFSVLNSNLEMSKFNFKKTFYTIFKDFDVDKPDGLFKLLNQYGNIFSQLITLKK